MDRTLNEIASLLQEQEKITMISHRSPDGDTIGSAMALYYALKKMGKDVDFLCSDLIPFKYHYMFEGEEHLLQKRTDHRKAAEGRFLVSVDVADVPLLGEELRDLADEIDVCIDHHRTSNPFGRAIYREADSAATGEIIYLLLRILGAEFDEKIASCIYTAISTDTGCFKYQNTSPRSYRIAADMVEYGAPATDINRIMFDTISRGRLELQKLAMETLEFHFGGKCVSMLITRDMMAKAGAKGEDVDGINTIPRQIEGSLIGITIRERKDGGYKVSLRSFPPADSARICAALGGGGHSGAAGCIFDAPLEEGKNALLNAAEKQLRELKLID